MEKKISFKDKLFGQKTRTAFVNTIIYIILATLGILWVLPIVYLLYTAFRVTPSTGIIYQLIPDDLELGFGNFVRLFQDTMFMRWMGNTILVAICSCALTTMFILMVSYAFSRMRFKMRKPLMNIMLVLGMFPGFMSMIAVYFILKAMGLTNSLLALILVYSGGAALSYYICKGFFDTLPRSLEEAAILDGASQWTVFWRITIPLAKPIIVYTALMAFISPWSDFIFAKVILGTNREQYTVAIGLFEFLDTTHKSTMFTCFAAGSILVAVPVVLLFIFLQRYYVEGITGGATKG